MKNLLTLSVGTIRVLRLFNSIARKTRLQLYQKETPSTCFLVYIGKFLRAPILKNICEQLLLKQKKCPTQTTSEHFRWLFLLFSGINCRKCRTIFRFLPKILEKRSHISLLNIYIYILYIDIYIYIYIYIYILYKKMD